MSPEERALLVDLETAGFQITSIWDWVNAPVYVPAALPTLIRHLENAQNEKLIEGIARALTNRRYREAEGPLVRVFARVSSSSVRWAVANAISVVGFRHSEDTILDYCADEHFGSSREMLVGKLHLIRRPEVEPLLIALLADYSLDYFAARALSRCGGPAGLRALESLELSGRSPRTRRKVPDIIQRLRARVAAA